MTIIRSIQCGDLEGFISKKDEILEEVNMMLYRPFNSRVGKLRYLLDSHV